MEKKVLKATEAEAELIYREYEQRKLNYEEKLKERMEAGKNRVGGDGDYQTGVADIDLQLAENAVLEIEDIISRLCIISKENIEESLINLDDIVTVVYTDTNELRKVKLTGGIPELKFGEDVDVITINSPLGKALYQRTVGEVVSFNVGSRVLSVQIVSREKSEQENAPKERGE